MSRGPRFTITISRENASGELNGQGGKVEADIAVDELQLTTVHLLEQWLKRWEWIARADPKQSGRLLVPDTFRILGTHLWSMVLDNAVGDKLAEVCRQARPDRPLRVLMSFEDASELAALPWEFLYYPKESGYFLVTRTELVLSRYIFQSKPPTLTPADQTLRVIFVVTMPRHPDFADERAQIRALRDELDDNLGDILDLHVLDPWTPLALSERLDRQKADIVHILGVCRDEGDRSSPQLYQDAAGGVDFVDSDRLVTAMMRSARSRPELVILHLCDWPGSNMRENFEGLARKIVEAGVPAVLAMQYPMTPGDASKFITQLYESLADNDDIGEAVQAAA